MNTTEVQAEYRPIQEANYRTVEGGAIMESAGALATIALAIVGLAGVFSVTIAAIAAIVLGAAIWMEGGALAASYRRASSSGSSLARPADWSESVSAEFLGGLTGIFLGILALLGISSLTLLSVATLVFGATFLFSGVSTFGSHRQALMGAAALVLGLLAVIGLNSLTLVLVAFACLGASALFHGAATSAKLAFEAHK